MTRVKDPLYRKIAEGLESSLDPKLFEECAVDLLRSVYPGLVPTGGPHDRGMDGAISTRDGPPTPLVCTTSSRALENLTRSLERYVEGGEESRAVVVATSRVLTPQKRRNLEARAKKLGFQLKNVHDGKDFAARLYDSPWWRKKLLGLVGNPPALSAYPRSWIPEAQVHLAQIFRAQRASSRVEEPLGRALLGWDEALCWLRAQEQDFVLVGPPGIGKTVLLQELAEEGRGLFVATSDEGRIVDAWRESRAKPATSGQGRSKPDFLLLPDVHLQPELLSTLLSLRRELSMDFRIAGTAWRSLQGETRVEWWPAPQEKAIGGLPREATVQVVSSVGIENDDIAEILDQSEVDPHPGDIAPSEHKPGLAVILALQVARSSAGPGGQQVKSGAEPGGQRVKSGTGPGQPCADDLRLASRSAQQRLHNGALVLRHVRASCKLDVPDLNVLGVAALGGRNGVTLANISKALQKSEADVRDVLLRVSSAGILSVGACRDGTVSVVPEALRDALITSTFFGGATSLPAERTLALVDDATSATSATAALVSALDRGLPVPHDIVRNRLPRDPRDESHRDLWSDYAWAGGKEAVQWILAQFSHGDGPHQAGEGLVQGDLASTLSHAAPLPPALAAVVAPPSLHFWPRRAVATLLPQLPNDEARLTDDEVHQAVCDWMRELGANVVPRRELILEQIARLSRNNGNRAVLSLVPEVFSLGLESTHSSRLAPGRIDTGFDVLPLDEIKELFALWPKALDVLKRAKRGVAIARDVAERWRPSPHLHCAHATDDWCQFVRECAARMISDIVTLADKRPGIVLWAHRTAKEEQLAVTLPPVDSEIDDLFSPKAGAAVRLSDRQTTERRKAATLAQAGAQDGARELLRLAEEGTLAGCSPEQQLQDLVEGVAQATEQPTAWVEALAGQNAPPAWVASFVDVALARGERSQGIWNVLLASTKYDDVIVRAGIRHGDVPERVDERIVERMQAVKALPRGMDWKNVSEAWKLRLLRDGREDVATTAARAMWWTGGLADASRQLLSAWVDVAARSDDELLLGEVFSSPSPIARRVACAWFLVPRPPPAIDEGDDLEDEDKMLERLRQAQDFHRPLDGLLEKAASVLDRTTKAKLIQDMPAETTARAFLAVVGRDPELYAVLLGRRDLSRIHLLPFRNGGARDLAVRALADGIRRGKQAGALDAGAEFALRALDAGYGASAIADEIEPDTSPIVLASASPRPDQRIAGIFLDRRNELRRTMEAWMEHPSPDVRNIAGHVLEREF